MSEHDEFSVSLLELCKQRFLEGRPVKIFLRGEHHILLMPHSLVEDGETGLLIIASSGGYYIHRPTDKPLNGFILVKHGFHLLLAKYISILINDLVQLNTEVITYHDYLPFRRETKKLGFLKKETDDVG